MKVVRAFSRFAHEYNKYNVIQKDVAKKLCMLLDKKYYNKVLDVGAGDGVIYQNMCSQNIKFSNFTALDFSEDMLSVHEDAIFVDKVCLNFNEDKLSTHFNANEFSLVISSSALQWSNNLEQLLKDLSLLGGDLLFSFFTANTFRTLHNTINITSPILKQEEIFTALNKVFNYEFEVIEYKLDFASVHEMLRYIKKSGVNGGVKQLSYKEIKFLMLEYPLDYLEFEVILVKVTGRK
ncbi:MAG: Biotin synthesis protein BioC [uncultured Sulfurovum sp.]|uniref:Biotin synthesis protein BioC n=1 Tax=uncultured Sulfurovum sp. TaxID=269237 RepID=A0A6S6SYP6_9BACT|nr:MAG: Biotin synthesis protein BioC [uncultured Sulfurovum sp.]